MKTKAIFGLLVVAVVAGLVYLGTGTSQSTESDIHIGVITPLTGGVAYWGESSRVGIRLAEQELKEKGVDISVIVEDGQLDPKVALNAAQKLVGVDGVDAIYSEFNPAAIAVSSYLKDKDMVQIYDAAPVSPLLESENFFKTTLDYEKSCEQVSKLLKKRGYSRIGVLKVNLEYGDLCAKGIRNVFGTNVFVESYNAGATDFRTPLAKFTASDVEVVFHAGFQPETLASLKNLRGLNTRMPFIGLMETMTPGVAEEFKDVLEGSIMFGMPRVSPELLARLNAVAKDSKLIDQNAAALAYLHITQLGEALSECEKETACVREKLKNAKPNEDAGFKGFKDRIAGFDTLIHEWNGEAFVEVQ